MSLSLFIGCSKIKTQKEYYPNNSIKKITKKSKDKSCKIVEEYELTGRLTKKLYYKNDNIDSLIGYKNGEYKSYKKEIRNNRVYQTTFYNNGAIKNEGFIEKDTLKTGWWINYDISGRITSKRDYFILCDDYYLNQSIVFNKKEDTIYKTDDFNETIFFDYSTKNVDNDRMELSYNISPISYRSKLELIFLANDSFCEEEKLDTLIYLKSNKGKLTLKKKNNYRGFLLDYYIDTTIVNKQKKFNVISRKIYFENSKKYENIEFNSSPKLL